MLGCRKFIKYARREYIPTTQEKEEYESTWLCKHHLTSLQKVVEKDSKSGDVGQDSSDASLEEDVESQ